MLRTKPYGQVEGCGGGSAHFVDLTDLTVGRSSELADRHGQEGRRYGVRGAAGNVALVAGDSPTTA